VSHRRPAPIQCFIFMVWWTGSRGKVTA
jgi:hypothetical protein